MIFELYLLSTIVSARDDSSESRERSSSESGLGSSRNRARTSAGIDGPKGESRATSSLDGTDRTNGGGRTTSPLDGADRTNGGGRTTSQIDEDDDMKTATKKKKKKKKKKSQSTTTTTTKTNSSTKSSQRKSTSANPNYFKSSENSSYFKSSDTKKSLTSTKSKTTTETSTSDSTSPSPTASSKKYIPRKKTVTTLSEESASEPTPILAPSTVYKIVVETETESLAPTTTTTKTISTHTAHSWERMRQSEPDHSNLVAVEKESIEYLIPTSTTTRVEDSTSMTIEPSQSSWSAKTALFDPPPNADPKGNLLMLQTILIALSCLCLGALFGLIFYTLRLSKKAQQLKVLECSTFEKDDSIKSMVLTPVWSMRLPTPRAESCRYTEKTKSTVSDSRTKSSISRSTTSPYIISIPRNLEYIQ